MVSSSVLSFKLILIMSKSEQVAKNKSHRKLNNLNRLSVTTLSRTQFTEQRFRVLHEVSKSEQCGKSELSISFVACNCVMSEN